MTVRIALIGCGAVARRFHIPAFRAAGADIVAFASRREASAKAAADEWGSGKVVGDWRELLALDDVDAVDICAPNVLHAEMTVAASRAGKHALVEKPMAITLEEADAMIRAAREAGTVLSTAHNVRFAPPFVAVRDQIASGSIGEVVGVRAAFGHSGPQDWAPEASWFFDRAQSGGGVLIDLGIHVADLLPAVLCHEVVEVSAFLRPGASGVEEAAQVIMRFDGGAIGSMHVSWNASPAPDHQLTIFGTSGTIHLDTVTPPVLRPAKGGEPRQIPIPARVTNPYAAFVDAVSSGTAPVVTGEDGRSALAIILAAYRSAEEGLAVTLDPPAR